MEASTRLFGFSRHILLPRRNPRFLPLRRKLPSCHRHVGDGGFRSSQSKPFLSLSSSPYPQPLSSNLGFQTDRHNLDPNSNGYSLHDQLKADSIGGDLGFGSDKGEIWTVVLLGWLGAEEKHLKRYAEMYSAKGLRSVRFVVPMKETVRLDLGKKAERRIGEFGEELVNWCKESEKDGKERCLIFHTFSNTGWLIYGVLLQNFQARNDIIPKIRGCVVDSAPCADISPQVWAAGYCAALLKKRCTSLLEHVEGRKLGGESNRWNVQDMLPALIEVIALKVLEIFFSLALMLPYANQRLSSIISTLKNQPPCPQLYLYSSADRVIPASVIESFIKEQKAMGRIVLSHDFGSSPHVDHLRTFPHIYSAKVYEFLKLCSSVSRRTLAENTINSSVG